MYQKAVSKLKDFLKYSGELFIMHEVGIMSMIGIIPTWMRDYCSVKSNNKSFQWMADKYELKILQMILIH